MHMPGDGCLIRVVWKSHKGGVEVSCGGDLGTLIAIYCEKMDEAE